MNKAVLGLVLGGVLGIVDGLTALFTPEVAPQIVGIVIGSTIKGLIVGVLVGWFATRVSSLAAGVVFGLDHGGVVRVPRRRHAGRERQALLHGDHAAGQHRRADRRLRHSALWEGTRAQAGAGVTGRC